MPPSLLETPLASKVLDSWAMLAWIRNEPSAPRVRDILQQADAGEVQLLMSWINTGEVYCMLSRKHAPKVAEEFWERLPSLPVRLVFPDEESVLAAARLKANRKISFADGSAAALAQREGAELVTGDPELNELADVLKVEWIGG